MVHYLLLALAGLVIVGGSSVESLASAGPAMDYVVACGVALMLKPWLEGHLE